MKTLKRITRKKGFLLITLSLFAFISCETDDISNTLETNSPIFNLDKFEQNILDYVNTSDSPIGWGYAINTNGQLARSNAFGKARTAIDGNVDFTLNKEINVASVSKFYTAIAAMQLLKANNLTLDDPVTDWLPESWEQGTKMDELSFKDLLKHESGFDSNNNNVTDELSYNGLRNVVENGSVLPKERDYLNVNFALFRILIPSLWKALPQGPTWIDIEDDLSTQLAFQNYLQLAIFDPLALKDVTCQQEDRSIRTLYYNINDNTLGSTRKGKDYGDWRYRAGGSGYHMSILEMAKVNAFFENTEVLVSSEQRDLMKQHRIGMERKSNSLEIHGDYYGKGGSLRTSSSPTEMQGVLTQIALFPNSNVECVVAINTRAVTLHQNVDLLQTMIYQAFNDAWE